MLESTLSCGWAISAERLKMKFGGRGHYPKAWTRFSLAADSRPVGAVGKTDERGASVVDRRVGVNDFLATICKAVGSIAPRSSDAHGSPDPHWSIKAKSRSRSCSGNRLPRNYQRSISSMADLGPWFRRRGGQRLDWAFWPPFSKPKEKLVTNS